MTYKAILFDLDGTLLDSAVHFHTILGSLAHQNQLAAPSLDKVRSWASNGAAVMIKECLGIDPNNALHTSLCDEFLSLYDEQVHHSCPLFEDIKSTLIAIHQKQLAIGIITNKGRRFYQHIEPQIAEIAPIEIGITRDDVSVIKPDPEGLLICTNHLSINANECLYIGDHKRDIEAAHNANMPNAVATWGYIQPGDQPELWNATHILKTPKDLLSLI